MFDLHTHTFYSDGKESPEAMVLAAIEKGLDRIGISDHSYTFFDESYCIKKEDISKYKEEIAALKEKYSSRISVLCGVEQDLYSEESTAGYDYIIGSVHYLRVGEEYFPIDEKESDFVSLCKNAFGGDYYLLAETYFKSLSEFAKREDVSIIGHFDLVSKFNEGGKLFDERNPRYWNAAKRALDILLAAGKTFEINTGAMARGYRSDAYPSLPMRKYIREKGGKMILSSDAHSSKTIAFAFPQYDLYLH